MNTKDWIQFYKINPDDNNLIETNLIYTPLVSPDGNTFCMSFDHTSKYQHEELEHWLPERPYYTKEMVKFLFDKEVKYINIFKAKSWAPKSIDINLQEQKIFFSWSGETCNQIIYSGRKLEEYCPTWKEQMFEILKDIVDSGYYKPSLYPHCYFIQDGILRTFDFYGCIEKEFPFIKIEDIKGMIGETSGPRFAAAVQNGQLNIEVLFKEALQSWVKWPDNVLPAFYRKLYE